MNIIKKQLSDLKPLEKNVRRHGDNQLEHFIESLKQFGQTRAFVVDEEGYILVGNGMHAAMTKMEWQGQVDCHVVEGLSELEKKKLVLSDNKVFQLGSDDFENIEDLLKEIAEEGDFNVAGYSADVLEGLLKTVDDVMEDMGNYGVLTPEETKKNTPAPVEEGEEEPEEEEYSHPVANVEPVFYCPCCGEALVMRGGELVAKED